jgi:hypothetical protein
MKIRKFNDMTKEEFIKWMEGTSFSYEGSEYWRELVDYGDNIYNEVSIENDGVVFMFEDGDGDTQRREMTFDEFVDRYNGDTLKY